jgi:hypothetical protein
MTNTKPKLTQYWRVFSPSALGMVFYVAIAAVVIVANQFSVVNKVLQLPTNLHVGRELAEASDKVLTSTIGAGRTTTLIVGLFWAGVGIVVYIVLRSLAKIATDLDENIGETRYIWPKGADRSRPLRQLFGQLLLRAIALAGLLAVLLGPLAEALHRPVLVHVLDLNTFMTYVVWFVALVLLMHSAVVLLRLVMLKPRVLG